MNDTIYPPKLTSEQVRLFILTPSIREGRTVGPLHQRAGETETAVEARVVPHLSLPLPASIRARSLHFWHPGPKPARSVRRKKQTPAPFCRHRPAPSRGKGRWRRRGNGGPRGGVHRRAELTGPSAGPLSPDKSLPRPQRPHAGVPSLPAHEGYLGVLLGQLLVLPLQLCRGHGPPARPGRAGRTTRHRTPTPSPDTLPGQLSHARPPARRRRASASPTSGFWGGRKAGWGRDEPGAGRRHDVAAPPRRAEHVCVPPRRRCLWDTGAILHFVPRWRPEIGKGRLKSGEEDDECPQRGRGTEERRGVVKTRGPEEETF